MYEDLKSTVARQVLATGEQLWEKAMISSLLSSRRAQLKDTEKICVGDNWCWAQVEKLEQEVKHLSDQMTPLGGQVQAIEQQVAASADRKTVSELQERLNAVDGQLEGMSAIARGELQKVCAGTVCMSCS